MAHAQAERASRRVAGSTRNAAVRERGLCLKRCRTRTTVVQDSPPQAAPLSVTTSVPDSSKNSSSLGRASPPLKMAQPKNYILTYFNFRARAELARILFAVSEVTYEDRRIKTVEQWERTKAGTPFGMLPVLSVDGIDICQSISIARFLAKEFGMAGQSRLEQARADMVVDCAMDMMEPIMPAYREQNPEKKEEMRSNYEEDLPKFMSKMDKLLMSNDSDSGYFVGDELTWADVAVMNTWHWIPGFGVQPPLELYPRLQAHKEMVEAVPQIRDWIRLRPITPV